MKFTQQNIKDALAMLGAAREYVQATDFIVSDLAEKVDNWLAETELRVAQMEVEGQDEPTDTAGGTDEGVPSSERQEKINYIRDNLETALGSPGKWNDPFYTSQVSDEELDEYVEQVKRLRKMYRLDDLGFSSS